MLSNGTVIALTASDWIGLAGVVVNGAALIGVIASLLFLSRQTKAARDATLALVYQNISGQMADINRLFVDHWDLREYFYANAAFDDEDPRRQQVAAIAELVVDFMDNALTQCPVLERHDVEADWTAYFRDLYDSSPSLREYWQSYGDRWYANSPLVRVFGRPREWQAHGGRSQVPHRQESQ